MAVPEGRNLVLASASPRRRELLAMIEPAFSVLPSRADESLHGSIMPAEAVTLLADRKARDVHARRPEVLVLAADTLVELDGRLIGKPENAASARSILLRLRGRKHRVLTGVALIGQGTNLQACVTTEIVMRAYSDADIAASIAVGTPFDKAGAYAIQDPALNPVEQYSGCYCNVMGLPLWDTCRLLVDAEPARQPNAPHLARPGCASCPRRGWCRGAEG